MYVLLGDRLARNVASLDTSVKRLQATVDQAELDAADSNPGVSGGGGCGPVW